MDLPVTIQKTKHHNIDSSKMFTVSPTKEMHPSEEPQEYYIKSANRIRDALVFEGCQEEIAMETGFEAETVLPDFTPADLMTSPSHHMETPFLSLDLSDPFSTVNPIQPQTFCSIDSLESPDINPASTLETNLNNWEFDSAIPCKESNPDELSRPTTVFHQTNVIDNESSINPVSLSAESMDIDIVNTVDQTTAVNTSGSPKTINETNVILEQFKTKHFDVQENICNPSTENPSQTNLIKSSQAVIVSSQSNVIPSLTKSISSHVKVIRSPFLRKGIKETIVNIPITEKNGNRETISIPIAALLSNSTEITLPLGFSNSPPSMNGSKKLNQPRIIKLDLKKYSESTKLQSISNSTSENLPSLQCPVCMQNIPGDLILHKCSPPKELSKPIPCTLCKVIFDDMTKLRDHMRNHWERLPYKCHICDVRYLTEKCLQRHILKHENRDKPFACVECTSKYVHKKQLLQHMANAHNRDRAPKKYTCSACGRNFLRKSDLTKHNRRCIEYEDAVNAHMEVDLTTRINSKEADHLLSQTDLNPRLSDNLVVIENLADHDILEDQCPNDQDATDIDFPGSPLLPEGTILDIDGIPDLSDTEILVTDKILYDMDIDNCTIPSLDDDADEAIKPAPSPKVTDNLDLPALHSNNPSDLDDSVLDLTTTISNLTKREVTEMIEKIPISLESSPQLINGEPSDAQSVLHFPIDNEEIQGIPGLTDIPNHLLNRSNEITDMILETSINPETSNSLASARPGICHQLVSESPDISNTSDSSEISNTLNSNSHEMGSNLTGLNSEMSNMMPTENQTMSVIDTTLALPNVTDQSISNIQVDVNLNAPNNQVEDSQNSIQLDNFAMKSNNLQEHASTFPIASPIGSRLDLQDPVSPQIVLKTQLGSNTTNISTPQTPGGPQLARSLALHIPTGKANNFMIQTTKPSNLINNQTIIPSLANILLPTQSPNLQVGNLILAQPSSPKIVNSIVLQPQAASNIINTMIVQAQVNSIIANATQPIVTTSTNASLQNPKSIMVQPTSKLINNYPVPLQTNTVSLQPVTVPLQPTTVPLQPATIPLQPSKVSLQPATVPVQTARVPLQPTTVPVQPARVPLQPATVPVQPATIPLQPAMVPQQPANVPVQPAMVPLQPATVPVEPSTDEDGNKVLHVQAIPDAEGKIFLHHAKSETATKELPVPQMVNTSDKLTATASAEFPERVPLEEAARLLLGQSPPPSPIPLSPSTTQSFDVLTPLKLAPLHQSMSSNQSVIHIDKTTTAQSAEPSQPITSIGPTNLVSVSPAISMASTATSQVSNQLFESSQTLETPPPITARQIKICCLNTPSNHHESSLYIAHSQLMETPQSSPTRSATPPQSPVSKIRQPLPSSPINIKKVKLVDFVQPPSPTISECIREASSKPVSPPLSEGEDASNILDAAEALLDLLPRLTRSSMGDAQERQSLPVSAPLSPVSINTDFDQISISGDTASLLGTLSPPLSKSTTPSPTPEVHCPGQVSKRDLPSKASTGLARKPWTGKGLGRRRKISAYLKLLPSQKDKPIQLDKMYDTIRRVPRLAREDDKVPEPKEGALYNCKHCKKTFSTLKDFEAHVAIHGANIYSCKYCSKLLSSAITLAHHEADHEDNRPFKCKECGKAYIVKLELERHMETKHTKKPYECHVCHFQFSCQANLDAHLPVHKQRKPCPYCTRTFTTDHYVKRHVFKDHAQKDDVSSPPK